MIRRPASILRTRLRGAWFAAGPSRAAAAAASIVAVLALTGCYSFAEPSFHPGDARQVLAAIVQHGVSVESAVTGASACDDAGLFGNALHLRGSVASDPSVRDIYLYTFKSTKWEASQAAVDACQASYQAANADAIVTRLDIPTFRAFGADWSSEMAQSLKEGLTDAAHEGE